MHFTRIKCSSTCHLTAQCTTVGSNCKLNWFSLILVVPGLWQSECLSDDEYQNLRPNNWTMSLTKVVALSAEKCKATIAAFKEAEVEPPELLLCKQT